jgi:hypothetical protein
MGEAMTPVVEARKAFEDARAEAKALVDRKRALLGRAMIQAREKGHGSDRESQDSIARKLGVVPEQVRRYEQAYRDWMKDHPGESLD